MKPHLQCAEQQVSRSNLTKYCACRAERLTYLVLITYETSFTMRGATGVPLQPHQILRLPQKMTFQKFWENLWKQDETSFTMRGRSENDPTMIRPWNRQSATRLGNRGYFSSSPREFLLKNTTFRTQSYIQTFTKCCACHDKWHFNVTKCCTCHKKWHFNFTKCCACHEKWHLNLTKRCTCRKKWHLQFTKCYTCKEKWHLNFTKCCTCHEKVTLELHQALHLPRKVTLARHQVLHLPTKSDTCNSPRTAPVRQKDSHT